MKAVPANLLQIRNAKAELRGEGVFFGKRGVKERGVIGAKNNLDAGFDEGGQGMSLEPGAGAGAEVRADADLERHVAANQLFEEQRIFDGADAVSDAEGAEAKGLPNAGGRGGFSAVRYDFEAVGEGEAEGGVELTGGTTEFIAADAEGDDVFSSVFDSEPGDLEEGAAAELAHAVEDPTHGQIGAAAFFDEGFENGAGVLLAPEANARRVDHLDIHNALGAEPGKSAAGEQAVVIGCLQLQDGELEAFEKTGEIIETELGGDLVGIEGGLDLKQRSGIETAFEMEVQLSVVR
jgi:hypothetical protein